MCGIAGWLRNYDNNKDVSNHVIDALKQRGPDKQDFVENDDFTFIHTRLKIIDLSAAADQPMSNADKTVWLVFNGEIYNYKELRAELIQKGHQFKSVSDTEVILNLYMDEGEACFKRLMGIFAIGIWDSREKKLVIARDRFGIKPLFYFNNQKQFAFASNLNALKRLPDFVKEPNHKAIGSLAAYFYIPAPDTFYKDTYAVEPCYYHTIHKEGSRQILNKHCYHQWRYSPAENISMEESTDRVSALLENAVRSQLVSDVPIGSLLSGGIDSSLVSYFAQKNKDAPIKTFNVKFPDVQYDETWAAIEVAKQIGSRHTTLEAKVNSGTFEQLSNIINYCGQPFADTSILPSTFISECIRDKVTVALSGDGGDEGFGGYASYQMLQRMDQMSNMPHFIKNLLSVLPDVNYLRQFKKASEYFIAASATEIVFNVNSWLRKKDLEELLIDCDVNSIMEPVNNSWEEVQQYKGLSDFDKLFVLSNTYLLKHKLPGDYLFKMDTASMMNSLEIRVPFLDEKLFEFAFNLPYKLKADSKEGKKVLRRLARKVLPAKVAQKAKWGFGLPLDVWVNEDCKKEIASRLLSPNSPLKDVLNWEVYSKWVKSFSRNETVNGISREGLYNRIFMLLSLEMHLH